MSRILFIDYDPELMQELWNRLRALPLFHHLFSGSRLELEVLFIHVEDPDLKYLADFEPYIVVINNDYGSAGQILDTYFSRDGEWRDRPIVVVTGSGMFPDMDLGYGREAEGWCRREVASLGLAIEDCIPF